MASTENLDESKWQYLLNAAREVRLKAYNPYSHLEVGAALLCEDDTVVSGCNVENASFGGTICAERNAVCAAVAQGHRKFKALALSVSSEQMVPICGLCLQVLSEFCRDNSFPIRISNRDGSLERKTTMGELFPGQWFGDIVSRMQSGKGGNP